MKSNLPHPAAYFIYNYRGEFRLLSFLRRKFMIKEKISKLINIKSIITLLMTIVFSCLSLNGSINSDSFMNIFLIVIAFYFGTQTEKKNSETEK